MFKVSHLITFRPAQPEQVKSAAAARVEELAAEVPHTIHARSRPSLQGSVNGGHMVCHLAFAQEAAWREARASHAGRLLEEFCASVDVCRWDWVAYRQQSPGLRQPEIVSGIHRSLILSVKPFTPSEAVARFEAEMQAMPAYIPEIRNWGLSRVVESGGVRPWSHVWEQEFTDAKGLFGPYMMHPIHFGSIDRWFDPQSHDWIVDPELCSTYCSFDRSALALSRGSN